MQNAIKIEGEYIRFNANQGDQQVDIILKTSKIEGFIANKENHTLEIFTGFSSYLIECDEKGPNTLGNILNSMTTSIIKI